MSLKAKIHGFTAWINLRLQNKGSELSDILVELMEGSFMKQLVESMTGFEMKRLDTYEGLTNQQKLTRIEWIMEELKTRKIVALDTQVDYKLFVARNSDQIFGFLWQLVTHDIYFVWQIMDYLLQTDLATLCKYPYTWIPGSPSYLPQKKFNKTVDLIAGFGSASVSVTEIPFTAEEQALIDAYKAFPNRDQMLAYQKNKRKHHNVENMPSPKTCLLELIKEHLKMTTDGRKLVVTSVSDLADVRVIAALANSFLPNAFSPEILLNDRWSINLILRCLEEIFSHKTTTFEAEDLVEGNTAATGAYLTYLFMTGYRFRQHRSALILSEQYKVTKKKCEWEYENEPLFDNRQKSLQLLKETEMAIKELNENFNLIQCKEWSSHAESVLRKTQLKVKKKLEEKYECLVLPRPMTISNVCYSLLVNLSLSDGAGFYEMNVTETVQPDRKIILWDIHTQHFVDDYWCKSHKKGSVKKLLKLPLHEGVVIDPEKWSTTYIIYLESLTKNKTLAAGQRLIYLVFPHSLSIWERILLKASHDGDANALLNLLNFFRWQSNLVNCQEKSTGNTGLHICAKFGHMQAAEALLEAGANYDAKNFMKFTPLACAIETGQREIAQLLIEWGCNIHLKNSQGDTPLETCKNEDFREYLLYESSYYCNLIPSIIQGSLTHLERMINDHRCGHHSLANLRSRCINGSTLLHTAAYFGSENMVSILLQMGVEPGVRDYKGATPLHRARTPSVMKILMDGGGNVTSLDDDGNTPLHMKCYGETNQPDDISSISYLLDSNCQITAINHRKLTPLHCAAMQGRIDVMKYLMITREDGKCGSELRNHIAAEDAFQPPSLVNLALSNDYLDAAKWLWENQFQMKNHEGSVLLYRIVSGELHVSSRVNTLTFLLKTVQVDPNTRVNESGAMKQDFNSGNGNNSPLHLAAGLSDGSDVVTLLLENGADVDALNAEQNTPLAVACQKNNVQAASILLHYGANIVVKNRYGLRALDYVPNYEEWIDSGLFTQTIVARLKAYSLKRCRDTVRSIRQQLTPHTQPESVHWLFTLDRQITETLKGSQQNLSSVYEVPRRQRSGTLSSNPSHRSHRLRNRDISRRQRTASAYLSVTSAQLR